MDTATEIIIRGQPAAVVLKRMQYAIREELVTEFQAATEEGQYRRVMGAAILLCCPGLLKESGLDYKAAGFSVMAFGGAAYSWLRDKGATLDEIIKAYEVLIPALRATLIPWGEVADRAGNSGAPVAG